MTDSDSERYLRPMRENSLHDSGMARKGDVIITWPKKRSLESYLAELEHAECDGLFINYRIAQRPRIDLGDWNGRPGRCYAVHDGAVRGFNVIAYVIRREEGEVTDPITGQSWPAGNYIVRDPIWHAIDPVPMAGFRGFRYAEGLL